MLDLEEALAQVLAAFKLLGQVLAEDVVAEMDIPPLANTAMDGYAVRCDDTGGALPDRPQLPLQGSEEDDLFG